MVNNNNNHTILVVDDVPVNVLLVKGMLTKQNFNVISASSGQQALEILNRETIDCILMDILMPNMNGFETTRAIKANPQTRNIPIIMLSALNSDNDIKEGIAAGANEFVTKPFVQDRLVATIQNQIRLASANRKVQEEEATPTVEDTYDGAMRLLTFVACQPQDDFARIVTRMSLCVPIDLINDDMFSITDRSVRGVIDWMVRRLQNYYVRNEKLSVNDCINSVASLIQPAAASRGVKWYVNLTQDVTVSADLALFRSLLTNLMSYACRISAGQVEVTANVDGGLTSIIISTKIENEDTLATNARVEVALEVASKMNGAVVCDRDDEGNCKFQIILQI